MKKLFFGSNLKMYKGIKDTVDYLQELEKVTKDISRDEIELFIIPSYTSLAEAVKSVDSKNIKLGAQNMCWEEQGQFTGEISSYMLKEIGTQLVMIGHSERRHVFGESNIQENKKVKKSLEAGFTTLLCIGETQEEKEYGIAEEVLRTQIKVGFYNVDKNQVDKIWIAYEPVWSIGVSGTPASAEYAEKIHKLIKGTLREMFGDASKKIPVLYGGSVNSKNAEELIIQPSIDGLFVGRAAWNAADFNNLIRKSISEYKKNKE